MKKSEIKIGLTYRAKVSGKVVTVRVDDIETVSQVSYPTLHDGIRRVRKGGTNYHVTNLTTGRKLTFRSAAKFRSLA